MLLVAGLWGYTSLKGASVNVDPSKLATVERGTMVRSVVATGKVEPVTKVEVKSKRANINVWARNSYSLKPAPRVKKK